MANGSGRITLRCWYCAKENKDLPCPASSTPDPFMCEHCGRRNAVELRFVAVKPEDERDGEQQEDGRRREAAAE